MADPLGLHQVVCNRAEMPNTLWLGLLERFRSTKSVSKVKFAESD
jgi:hypothetical protein